MKDDLEKLLVISDEEVDLTLLAIQFLEWLMKKKKELSHRPKFD